jgi:hypothetical protein
MSRQRCHVVRHNVGYGRLDTLAHVGGGLGKCHAAATCVHDPAPCVPPDGRCRSSNVPGCASTSAADHGTPADHTRQPAKKYLLRDHALTQLPEVLAIAAKLLCADGAPAGPGRARLGPLHPGAVGLAASPPASAGPIVGTRGPGNNADSNGATDTCAHSLCAGRPAAAVVAVWYGRDHFLYHDAGPREVRSPKGQPGENALTFSSGTYPTAKKRS